MAYPVTPAAEPLHLEGHGSRARTGVLLSHGFTGMASSMKPWAEALNRVGYTVEVPRLPGHGTHWREMNRTRWQDWYIELDRVLVELLSRTDRVVVGGLSMGGTLVTRLAELHSENIAAVMLVNPAYLLQHPALRFIGLLKHLPGIPGIGSDVKKQGVTEECYSVTPLRALSEMLLLFDVVKQDIGRMTQPVALWRSQEDHVVPQASAEWLLSALGERIHDHVLEDSYHVATLDNDAETLFAQSISFLDEVLTTQKPR